MRDSARNKITAGLRALLPEAERERFDRYAFADCGHGTDIFGTKLDQLQSAFVIGYWLHQHYFRVESHGHWNVPSEGAGVVVGNHSGVLPFDGLMITVDVFRRRSPPRLVRYMVDYFVYRLPFLGTFMRSLGQVSGTRRNFDGIIEGGHLVGIFPEGADALGKPASKRYELDSFSPGHVELAARHKVPVIPFGLVGAEEQQTVLTDIQPLARALGVPYVPVTTTFPWFGPLGLLPKPVKYFIEYGSPIQIDPDVLHSVEVRSREVNRVRDSVADLIEQGLQRRKEFFGDEQSENA